MTKHSCTGLIKFLVISVLVTSCNSDYYFPTTQFDNNKTFIATDYSELQNWAAHPEKEDPADRIPESEELRDQSEMEADVFFIHPTTLSGWEGEEYWNANVADTVVNNRTDETTILLQASIFNKAGKVYSPRYQQAHVQAYYTKDTITGRKALEWAYKDVRQAFTYYIEHENKGRPFILAGHSQGTTHAKELIKEFIDDKPLRKQLIAAYLVGIIVEKDEFKNLYPCESPDDTGCTISWRTFRKDIEPDEYYTSSNVLATNPLSWKIDEIYVPKSENKGTILRNINKVYDELVDAQVDNGILKVSKPSFFGSIFYTTKNYHIPDLNFFYFNTQENAVLRKDSFLQQNGRIE